MENPNQKLSLSELINQTRDHLISLNYTKETLRHYENAWRTLKNYAEERNTTNFSMDFGVEFLKTKYNIDLYDRSLKSHPRTVRRAVTVLNDYQQHGVIFKRQATRLHRWSEEYEEICKTFLDSYANNRLSSRTARIFKAQLEKLTLYLVQNKVKSIANVSPSIIDGYISTYSGYSKRTLDHVLYILRSFFKFVFNQGLTVTDLSTCIPRIKINTKSTVPSTFSIDEIERLLSSIDRGNPTGKRDFAILLLAVRYGMRVSEITSLQLSNLNFETKEIQYIQNKTNNLMKLNLIESVGWAIIDYLRNGRPQTSSNHVFVRHVAPFDAFGENNNLSNIINKYLTLANIDISTDRKHGIHTLRHSLASRLLEQGTPLHVVSEALGHLELNSTTIYTKINMHQLSLCPLEVPYEAK
ncbi:MAG: tyrosine-type recombinase/integrase [Tissierellales bacterium]|nr:tyrosine-type recombinase/integrase [Tissierellales bacterium]MBN2828300.1 tyrosine-type recombinase/integrase [Tissierellales bacterium]